MANISATDASERFADILDAVEHRGETLTVLRRGCPIATVTPVCQSNADELRKTFARHRLDDAWADDLATIKEVVGPADTGNPWKN